jgi:RNA polymerase sigma-70 factor (ECF subfamily)
MDISGQDEKINNEFKELVRQYSKGLFSLCFRLSNNVEEAEDILQKSFLKAYRNYKTYDSSKSSIYTWLYRITTNVAIDHFRENKKHISNNQGAKLLDYTSDSKPNQEDTVSNIEEFKRLQQVISTLPENQQLAISLTYFDEFKMKEAAEILDISVKAYESLLIRARKKLRELLQ